MGLRRRRDVPRRLQHRRAAQGGGAGGATTTPGRGRRPRYAGPPAPSAPCASGWPATTAGPTCAAPPPARRSPRPKRRPCCARLGPDPLRNRARRTADAFAAGAVRRRGTPARGPADGPEGDGRRRECLPRRGAVPAAAGPAGCPGRALAAEAAGRLWDDTAAIMADGVRDGRIITTPPGYWTRQAPTSAARPGGRPLRLPAAGPACRVCGTPVALTELAARKLYWCPTCQQPEPAPERKAA